MKAIRRTSQRVIHRAPAARVRQRATEPTPWWIDGRPKRGRPRTSMNPNSTTNRGYGSSHQKLRKALAAQIAAGAVFQCARCGRPIRAGDVWELGHADAPDAHALGLWSGPEHRRCNQQNKSRQQTQQQTQQQTRRKRPRALDFFDTS